MKTIKLKKTAKFSVLLFAMALAFIACKQDPTLPPKDGGGIVIDNPNNGGGNGGGVSDDPKDGGGEKPPVGDEPVDDNLPKDPANPDKCSFEGQLFHPIDGCKWAIKTNDGTWLYPLNQDKLAGLGEGDKIRFGYVYKHDAFTSCMAGYNK
jgi:hypothetical protein